MLGAGRARRGAGGNPEGPAGARHHPPLTPALSARTPGTPPPLGQLSTRPLALPVPHGVEADHALV